MLILASALAAIIPMLTYLTIIWRFDRYDREPFGLLLRNYFWGALGAIILALIASGVLAGFFSFFIQSKDSLDKTETILIAPFVEEITKGIFLFITVRNIKFDNMTDGIVYGGAIGLGFGMTENFLYFIAYGNSLQEWVTIVIIRTLFSAVMHCVSTATFGAFLGYAKFKDNTTKTFLIFSGLITAMFIHFAWNFSVSFESTAMLGFLFMIFTVIIFIIVYSISVKGESKIIYDELLPEAESGLIPMKHLLILNSTSRNRHGWIDESIRKLYVSAATTLAFRKVEWKNSKGRSKTFYENEIEYYRNFILNLLSDKNNIK
ncbi:MAG: PrsW family intramembrane metalloprotease [Ignavibacteriaceae bacterium]